MIERQSAPVWVRTLDVLCVLLAAMAAIVAVSGGFRAHAGGMRLAVTSPLPLLLWSVAITVARHAAVPQQPLYRELSARLAGWCRLAAVRNAAAVVVGTRPAMLCVGYLSIFMIGYAKSPAPPRHLHQQMPNP